MSDEPEQQPADPAADEPSVDTSGNVLNFHVGDVRQAVAVPPSPRLRVPGPRPAFGVDDEGNPRPDPTLAAPDPSTRRAAGDRARPSATPSQAPDTPPLARRGND